MIQPERQKLVVFDVDAIELIVWTDVPPNRVQEIDGVYDAYSTRPMVIRCDPRYNIVDIENAITILAQVEEAARG